VNTPLCRQLGISFPVVQAPMAGVAGGELAAAVTAAGGLGTIGFRGSEGSGWLREQAALAAAAGPFGVGLQIWKLQPGDGLLEEVLDTGPALVSLSFGDPAPYAAMVRDREVLLASQVQTSEAARQALDAGVDVLVAQGTEAGGHTGSVATLPLLQEVLPLGEAAGVPVVAAGGIATGRGLAGALAMGAQAVWVGTRFAATHEAAGTAGAKRRIVEAASTDTVLTHVFDVVQEAAWPTRFPGRALTNELTDRWHGREDELAAELPGVQERFRAAVERDDRRVAHVYAGQASGLVREIPTAAQVVQELVDGARARLREVSVLSR
jgi:nitronate monooxygenase